MDDSRFQNSVDDAFDEPLDESLDGLDEAGDSTSPEARAEATDRRLYRALGMYIVLGALAYWRLDGELLWFILFLFAVLAIKTYLVVVQQRMD